MNTPYQRFTVPFSALKLAAFASETLGKATGGWL